MWNRRAVGRSWPAPPLKIRRCDDGRAKRKELIDSQCSAFAARPQACASAPPQYDDAVAVGPLGVVLYAPAIGRLGEALAVDHHEQPVERQTLRRLPDQTLEQHLAAPDLADLEGDMAAARDEARKLDKRVAHHV